MPQGSAQGRNDVPPNDVALDALGDVLRACGDHAFDTHAYKAESLRQRAEQWARHLLIGAPHPEHANIQQRDFGGARRFVRELRAVEQQFVRSALTDFRSMISSVFGNIERALVAESDGDKHMKASLAKLRGSVQSASLEELRREVTNISSELSDMLVSRERRRAEQLETLGSELKQLNNKLEVTRKTAETDALTGLFNRRALDTYMERVAEFDGLTGSAVSLLMIDVDDFKKLNDTYGHPAGDAALRAIGGALSRTFLRKCDFVARFGGEEFAAVLRDTNVTEARRASDRARTEVARVEIEGQPEIALSISIGVAQLNANESVVDWLKRSDNALLEAKRTGKNRSVVAR
jgi:diguanylate cyclase